MNARLVKTLIAAVAAGSVASTAAFAQTTAIMNGQVHTVSGDVIENGDVIITNGRISQVGANLSAPAGATVIDASGKVVTPGIFVSSVVEVPNPQQEEALIRQEATYP